MDFDESKCGTYSGYSQHRRKKTVVCQPCRDAMNAYRNEWQRANKKNTEYGKKYRANHPDKVRQYYVEYVNRPEQVEKRQKATEQRQHERLTRAAARKEAQEAERLAKKVASQERLEAQKAETRARKEAQKAERALIRAQREAEQAEQRKLREEAAYWARLKREVDARDLRYARKELRELAKEDRRREKAERDALLASQHGTSINDYYRCKKNNMVACGPCLAAAAKYRRDQVAQDPQRFLQQKKDYYKRYPEKKTEANRRKGRRDRARRREVPHEPYSTQDILDLWGTECHICSEPIDLTASRQCGDPGWERGLHLDHVIPLSKGGPDTIANVKPSHAKCNTDKRDSLL